jgi:UDP-N-acetylglucosamine acyltransferase
VLDGLNVVGLRRRGIARDGIRALLRGYRALFLGKGVFRERLEAVEREFDSEPLMAQVLAFIRAGKSRPLMHPLTCAGSAQDGAGDDTAS